MSDFILDPAALDILTGKGELGMYQFDTKIARHYFCKTCGIYPFHETLRKPGHYRVNLGCIDELVIDSLDISVFDGRHLL